MIELKVGQTIKVNIAVWDFCSETGNDAVYISDVAIDTIPALDPNVSCQDITGLGIKISLATAGSSECHGCTPTTAYSTWGTAFTDSKGLATLEHTITEEDMASYKTAVSLNSSVKVLACIVSAKGQTILNHRCSDTVAILSPEYTHTLKLYMRPWGWYSPQGAGDAIVTKMADINGQLLNFFTAATGYSYVKTDIEVGDRNVVLNIRLNEVQAMSPLASWVLPAVALIVVIIGFIGLIYYISLMQEGSTKPKESEPVPPGQQKPGVQTTDISAVSNCLTLLPSNPTCTNLTAYATCLDSVHAGIYGTLMSVYPEFSEFRDTYEKYLNLYSRKAAECNPSVPGKTPTAIYSDIQRTREDYKKELGDNYAKLQRLYESQHDCWIANPLPIGGGCLLTAGTGKVILGTVIAVAVIGGVYWAVTRKPKETKVFIKQAGVTAKAAGEAVKAEYGRAVSAYRELKAPPVPAGAIIPVTARRL